MTPPETMTARLDAAFHIDGMEIRTGGRPFVITEAGSNFNQSLDTARQLIDVAAKAGADAVKFQLFRAEVLVGKDSDAYEMFKLVELNPDWVPQLDAHCRENGVHFMASAFDKEMVDVLEAVDVRAYKVASSETANLPLLAHIAATGKPLIIATGMCDLVDVAEAVTVCIGAGNSQVALLQCASVYPLAPEDANLRVMDSLASCFGGPIGYSDHTLGVAAGIAAVARGAAVIEKHFTLDRTSTGPDHFYALEPDELARFIADLHEAHAVLGHGEKRLLPEECQHGRRDGLYAARDIAEGAVIGDDDVIAKRPPLGLRSRYSGQVIGSRARRPIAAGKPLGWDDMTL